MSFNSHSVWLWSFPIYNSALDLQSHAACLRKAILKRHRQGSFLYLLQFHYILSCHDPFLLNSRLVNILHISSFVSSRYLSVLRIQRLQFFFKTFTQHCHHTISNFIKEKKKEQFSVVHTVLSNFQGMVRIKMRCTGKPCFVNFQSNLIVINEDTFLLSCPLLMGIA